MAVAIITATRPPTDPYTTLMDATRRQARLGRLTPVEYEAIMYEQVALAA